MRLRSVVAVGLVLGSLAAFARADTWPLAELKTKAKGTTALGNWSLAAFAGRNDFPFLADRKELEEVESGRWALPARGAGEIKIDDTNLNVRSAGMQNNEENDKWLAAVVFTAKEAASYAVTGKVTGIWCDSDKAPKNAMKWAVLRGKADGKKFKAVAGGECGDGDSLDLASAEKLKSIPMEAGETLVITLFRPGHWGAAGGNLTGLNIDKAAATPAAEPAKTEEKK